MTISGAQGGNAGTINGTYDPAEGSTGGQPHYRRRGGGDWWLAYCASNKQWWVQAQDTRGTATGVAYIKNDPPRLPHLTQGAWRVCTDVNAD